MTFDNNKTTHFKKDLLCIPQVHKEILKLIVGIQGNVDDHEREIRQAL